MAGRTRQRKGSVAEGKSRVSSHSVGQVMNGFLHHDRIARGAEPVAPHEFRIRQRLPAIPWALLQRRRTQRPVQCARDLLRDLALESGEAFHVEIAFLCEASALQICVKHLQGEPPFPF